MIGDILRGWLLRIIAAGMLVSVLYALLPRGRMQTVARGIGGVLLLLVLLQPVTELEIDALSPSYEDCRREIEVLTEEYRRTANEELTAIIEEKTGAYIVSKGMALGIRCTVAVETTLRDGVPYPAAVTLDIPKHEALSTWIAQELDIDEAHQRWKEGEAAT